MTRLLAPRAPPPLGAISGKLPTAMHGCSQPPTSPRTDLLVNATLVAGATHPNPIQARRGSIARTARGHTAGWIVHISAASSAAAMHRVLRRSARAQFCRAHANKISELTDALRRRAAPFALPLPPSSPSSPASRNNWLQRGLRGEGKGGARAAGARADRMGLNRSGARQAAPPATLRRAPQLTLVATWGAPRAGSQRLSAARRCLPRSAAQSP